MSRSGSPLLIDGSYGEGGGSLLRTALVMSAVTTQPFHIFNIRFSMARHGMTSEDLAITRVLARMCNAEMDDAELGSSTLTFTPKRTPRSYNEPIKTPESDGQAGSANAIVVLNTLLPALARCGAYSDLSALGETHGHNVLSFDYFNRVTLPALENIGLYAQANIQTAGYGWGSRGLVQLSVEPSSLGELDWPDRGDLVDCQAIITTSELSASIAQRGKSHLDNLARHTKLPLEVTWIELPSKSPGVCVTIWSRFTRGAGGAVSMGAKGLRMEAVVQRALDEFMTWMSSSATTDPYLADHLIGPCSLSKDDIVFTTSMITKRLLTTAWVIKQFVPIRLTIKGSEGQAGTITIKR